MASSRHRHRWGSPARVVGHLPADRRSSSPPIPGSTTPMASASTVDLVVGDLDSVSAGAGRARAAGIAVERHARPRTRPTSSWPSTRRFARCPACSSCASAAAASGLDHVLAGLLSLAAPDARRPRRPGVGRPACWSSRARRAPPSRGRRRLRQPAAAPRSCRRRDHRRPALPAPRRAPPRRVQPRHQQRGRCGRDRERPPRGRDAPAHPSPRPWRHAMHRRSIHPSPQSCSPCCWRSSACGSDSSSGGGATTAPGSSAGTGGSAAPAVAGRRLDAAHRRRLHRAGRAGPSSRRTPASRSRWPRAATPARWSTRPS